jgi:hypothetical protein
MMDKEERKFLTDSTETALKILAALSNNRLDVIMTSLVMACCKVHFDYCLGDKNETINSLHEMFQTMEESFDDKDFPDFLNKLGKISLSEIGINQ